MQHCFGSSELWSNAETKEKYRNTLCFVIKALLGIMSPIFILLVLNSSKFFHWCLGGSRRLGVRAPRAVFQCPVPPGGIPGWDLTWTTEMCPCNTAKVSAVQCRLSGCTEGYRGEALGTWSREAALSTHCSLPAFLPCPLHNQPLPL